MAGFSSHLPPAQRLPLLLLAPLPLPMLQPILRKIAVDTARCRPELFGRLGLHGRKRYLIDPLNMPFVLLLSPDPRHPTLRAHRRSKRVAYDARIAGTFLTLLAMIDGRLDGDALFFTRDLMIEGDTEAVVVLRNALDDLQGSLVEDMAGQFGALGRVALTMIRRQ